MFFPAANLTLMRLRRLVVAWFCLLLAVVLGRFTTDREFINLAPTEHASNYVLLKSGSTYDQFFLSSRQSITRVGVFLKAARQNPTAGTITLTVLRAGQAVREAKIDTAFIDSEGFTQTLFRPPISTQPGEQLHLRLSVPENISGQFVAVTRAVDPSFAVAAVPFNIAGQAQPAPLAHQVYFAYRPALAPQLALLLTCLAIILLWPRLPQFSWWPLVYGAILGIAAVMPAMLLGKLPWLLVLGVWLVLTGTYYYLRSFPVRSTAAWLGAYSAALTTWWPLHTIGGQEKLLVVSLVPWLLYCIRQRGVWTVRKLLFGAALLMSVAFLFLVAGSFIAPPELALSASLKDIFLDPYQAASAQKISGQAAAWYHFGSYLGSISLAFALVGVATHGWGQRTYLVVGMGCLLLLQLAPRLVIPHTPIPYLIIVTSFVAAYFAAWGLEQTARYLSPRRHADSILAVLTVIVLLDLLYVFSGTLEAAYLL